MFIPQTVSYLPKTSLIFDVISVRVFSIPVPSGNRFVQSYLIMSLPDFLLRFSLKLFVCGIPSPAISDLMSGWLSFTGIFQIQMLIADYSGMSRLYVFAPITSELTSISLQIIKSGIPIDHL
jgi:hypothetical protein